VCTPTSTKCADANDVLTCNSSGQWPAASTPCTGMACYPDHCSGSCSPGTYRCNTTSKNPDKCDVTGSWGQIATCNTPSQICQASSGTCVPNNPYDIGYSNADSSWSNFEPATDTAYLVSFVAPTTATITALRVTGRVAGGSCDMFVYTDSGGSPSQRLTYANQINVGAGFNGAVPAITATVTGGQTYWVGGDCDNSPGTVELYQKNVAGPVVVQTQHTFGTFMPTTFPASFSKTSDIALSFYMQVQNVP
jgi:hypothetical protein